MSKFTTFCGTIAAISVVWPLYRTIEFEAHASPRQKAAFHQRIAVWKIAEKRRAMDEEQRQRAHAAWQRRKRAAEAYRNSDIGIYMQQQRRAQQKRGRERLQELFGQ